MKYFSFIEEKNSIFFKQPMEYGLSSSKETLSYALGATLYMSATRKNLLEDLLATLACSIVICLEDSVSTNAVQDAENHVIALFDEIEKSQKVNENFIDALPLIFIRTRSFEQFNMILSKSNLVGLCGFVFPKFTSHGGEKYLNLLKRYNYTNGRTIYALPILETPQIIFKEGRTEEILTIKHTLDLYKEIILNIRIGGTDLSGIFGLRRNKDCTIYDIAVIKDCICDIINVFKREEYVISGPVYEHFDIPSDLQCSGLVRETLLDRANGLTGKTVIHPNQINIVNSLLVVSKEEYLDAETIVNSCSDGVIKSLYSNKMNEVKPHLKWAKNILLLSKIMGVLNDGKCYEDILRLTNRVSHRSEFGSVIKYKSKKIRNFL